MEAHDGVGQSYLLGIREALMAARINKIRHDENTREKIRTSQLLNRLQDHALGTVEMSSTQVRAAEVCLRKVLPDLSESNVTTTRQEAHDYSRAELIALLEESRSGNGSDRASEEDGRPREPDSVH